MAPTQILNAPTCGLTLGGTTATSTFQTTSSVTEIVFAVMYNTEQSTIPVINPSSTTFNNTITLNAYGVVPLDEYNCDAYGSMNMAEFLNLFYPNPAGYFNINLVNANNPALLFNRQTYSGANSEYNSFSLPQVMLRAFSSNNGLSVNEINPATRILVNKECQQTRSIATIQGTVVSLSWTEVIEALLSQGSVDLSGNSSISSSQAIPLVLIVNYYSKVLNTTIQIKFTYYVNITGYGLSTTSAAQVTYNGKG